MKKSSSQQRGFALLIVTLLVGLLSLTAASMLDVVSIDQSIGGQATRTQRADSIAETGVFEVLSNNNLGSELLEATPVRDIDPPGGANALMGDTVSTRIGGEYDASITFLRERDLKDYGQNDFRSAVYDIDVEGRTPGDGAASRRRVQVEKPFAIKKGTIRPEATVTR